MRKARYSDDFVVREAEHILSTYATYKQTSQTVGAPISTVGWHIKRRLYRIDPILHQKVMLIISIPWRKRIEMHAENNGGDQ